MCTVELPPRHMAHFDTNEDTLGVDSGFDLDCHPNMSSPYASVKVHPDKSLERQCDKSAALHDTSFDGYVWL